MSEPQEPPAAAGPEPKEPRDPLGVARPVVESATIRAMVAPFLLWLAVMAMLAVIRAQAEDPFGPFWIAVFKEGSALAFVAAAIAAVAGVIVIERRRATRS